MKKILTMIVVLLLTGSVFAKMKITRNRVMGLAGLTYTITERPDETDPTEEVSYTTMGLLTPNIEYQMVAKPNDILKMYIYGGLDYDMAKASVDGKSADNFSSDMDFVLEPIGKFYLPHKLFVKLGLPFAYSSETGAEDDAEAMTSMSLDGYAKFGIDTRKEYIHGLTDWDQFEDGYAFYGKFQTGIMGSKDKNVDGDIKSVDVEDFKMYIGFESYYAYLKDNMMIRPFLKYKMQLNEDAADKDSYIHIGADFAKDFDEKLNLHANLDFEMKILEETDDHGNDSHNTLLIDVMANYYVIPELAVGGGLGMIMDLTDEDANPVYSFLIGAEYTLDFISKK